MTSIVKHIPLVSGTSSTVSTSYTALTAANAPFTYDASAYDGSITAYFEANVSVASGGTGYTQLYDFTAGAVVTGGEVTTTSSSYTRKRSSSVTLVDGHLYGIAVKSSSGSYAATCRDARIILVQSGTITKTRTVINMSESATTTSTAYANHSDTGVFKFVSTDWGGTVAVYFEADLTTSNASGTATAALASLADAIVTNSPVTSTSTHGQYNIVRSAGITLVDGTSYKVQHKNSNGSYTTTTGHARIIIDQTVSALPTCLFSGATFLSTTTNTTRTNARNFTYHDDAEWSGVTNTVTLGGYLKTNNASGIASLAADSSGTGEFTTTQTTFGFVEGSSFTPVDDTEYSLHLKSNNASYTTTTSQVWVIYKSTASSPQTISADLLTLVSSAKTITPVPGVRTIGATKLVLASSAKTTSRVTGPISLPVSRLTFDSTVWDSTLLKGGVSPDMNTVTMSGVAGDTSLSVGGVIQIMDAAALSGSARTLTAYGGAISLAVDALSLASTPHDTTVSMSVLYALMNTLGLAGSIKKAVLLPGQYLAAMDALNVAVTPNDSGLYSTVSIGTDTIVIGGSLKRTAIIPGGVLLAMDKTGVSATPFNIAFSGAVTIAADKLDLVGAANDALWTGRTAAEMSALSLASSVADVLLVPGGAIVTADMLTIATWLRRLAPLWPLDVVVMPTAVTTGRTGSELALSVFVGSSSFEHPAAVASGQEGAESVESTIVGTLSSQRPLPN